MQAGLQRDSGAPSVQGSAGCQACVLQRLGTSLVSRHCLGTAGLPFASVAVERSQVPHRAWTGRWSSVLGAALEGSMKWHQRVGKGSGFGKFKKGWFQNLAEFCLPTSCSMRGLKETFKTSPNSAGLLLSGRLFLTSGYGIILVLSSFSWFSLISPEPWDSYIPTLWTRK